MFDILYGSIVCINPWILNFSRQEIISPESLHLLKTPSLDNDAGAMVDQAFSDLCSVFWSYWKIESSLWFCCLPFLQELLQITTKWQVSIQKSKGKNCDSKTTFKNQIVKWSSKPQNELGNLWDYSVVFSRSITTRNQMEAAHFPSMRSCHLMGLLTVGMDTLIKMVIWFTSNMKKTKMD